MEIPALEMTTAAMNAADFSFYAETLQSEFLALRDEAVANNNEPARAVIDRALGLFDTQASAFQDSAALHQLLSKLGETDQYVFKLISQTTIINHSLRPFGVTEKTRFARTIPSFVQKEPKIKKGGLVDSSLLVLPTTTRDAYVAAKIMARSLILLSRFDLKHPEPDSYSVPELKNFMEAAINIGLLSDQPATNYGNYFAISIVKHPSATEADRQSLMYNRAPMVRMVGIQYAIEKGSLTWEGAWAKEGENIERDLKSPYAKVGLNAIAELRVFARMGLEAAKGALEKLGK